MNLEEFFRPHSPVRTNFGDCLTYWTQHQPDETAFVDATSGKNDEHVTYSQLDRRARAIAARLTELGMRGERAILLYAPGLDFVQGLLGCMYAGVVAVPAYPPMRTRYLSRIEAISDDCQAKVALTTKDIETRTASVLDKAPTLERATWISTDEVTDAKGEGWVAPTLDSTETALLQYTSGSTGTPKGVLLSHANLMHNVSLIIHAFEPNRSGIGLTWLPTYHDMGLVGGVLMPLFYGRPNVLMSPLLFLQKPARWLQKISEYNVTISGGPNFAYDLCVDKITDAEMEGVDLSTWDVAFDGAEPIRPETLKSFSHRFKKFGFRPEAFYPCYGMAETTLIVTGGNKTKRPVIRTFDGKELDAGRATSANTNDRSERKLVGCGHVLPDEEVVVVDPAKLTRLPAGHVGEICVQSPSVGQGYWNNPTATAETFRVQIEGVDGLFLRTGDFGFIDDEELFVTGRIKDLIIVRGVNRYPQDIESTVERTDSHLHTGVAAAFTVERDGQDCLVVVSEVGPKSDDDWSTIIRSARENVALEHELVLHALVLTKLGSLPRTSSGKIQRHACKDAFEAGTLSGVVTESVQWPSDLASDDFSATTNDAFVSADERSLNEDVDLPAVEPQVASVVMDEVRAVAQERGKGLVLDTNLIGLGLDSLERLQIANTLEETFGGRLPAHVLAEIETCREVALAIQEHIGSQPLLAPPASVSQPQKRVRRKMEEGDYNFAAFPEYQQLKQQESLLSMAGLSNPYFSVHEGLTSDTTSIGGQELVSFTSYNYLSMSGDPKVSAASKDAIDRFGTSVSASRLVSGEKTIHGELERAIANLVGSEDSIVFVGGHATNETTIGHLFGTGDLILHDALAHNSIMQGSLLSGARRRSFAHNDWHELDSILDEIRHEYRRVLIVIEGVYSMDGDFPDLPRFIEVKKKHQAFLMVDEAHSIGTMGQRGRGLGEHYAVDPSDVDLWMGTLSKSFGSCGGYIAGSCEVVEYLKYTAPGFVYSVGLSPANAGAALASIEVLNEEPQRVERLKANSRLFLELAKARGLDTGLSRETPVIPVVLGSSVNALRLSLDLKQAGINVQPILYPAVEEAAARLRFFITSSHTESQIRQTVDEVAVRLRSIQNTAGSDIQRQPYVRVDRDESSPALPRANQVVDVEQSHVND